MRLFYLVNILYDKSMSQLVIKENESLARHTSFRIGGPARHYIEITSANQLVEAMDFVAEKKLPWLALGGGSNMLVSDQGYEGVVLHICLKGMKLIQIDENRFELKVGAGEVWDDVVNFAVLHNLWEIENLSHIPGLAGGFPVQNVGAYGQEASQVIKEVYVYDIKAKQPRVLSKDDCQFAYRQSIFNTTKKEKYIITGLTLDLVTTPQPNLAYKDLAEYFTNKTPTLLEIRQAVIAIRDKKLPHPKDIGSAGSFFKNLELSLDQYKNMAEVVKGKLGQEKYEDLEKLVKQTATGIKVPTAFVIDRLLGLKGLQIGGAKIYEQQALVIINYSGQAQASDVLSIFKKVRTKAKQLLGIEILPEPNLIGFSQNELDYYFSFE